ncbi:TadE/TadG family type IV pilus assembly protein [Acidocella sp.]|uniref:TadE/TadG family type IV pilus assembly protein n=1 Tax=Acidocella sp. TaxID=50710 RepID=UPI0026022393|nr:TadE/TadG family type IV pilus assembly protein [Acidocella sp.]MDD2795434.1 pilus assembly protein [Acidocella sp.]
MIFFKLNLRCLKDRRSVAAVEFALVVPFLLLMFIGTIEVLTLYRTEAKLNALTANVAQMIAVQSQSTITGVSLMSSTGTTQASLQDVCQGAILGLAPFPANGMNLSIASVTLESGPTGLPNPATSTAKAYSTTNTYDAWESDFTVSGNTCTPSTSNLIGLANAEQLATTSPPSTTGTSGTTGMLGVPCDNALIVKATLTYPGILGIILTSRPSLTQMAFMRWRYAGTKAELQCPSSDTGCTTSYVTTQLCNTSNTSIN